ncbi:MAG: hypothetical protein PUC30_12215 [Lachnospiraceae bacterium]|nr:hypothetical protein [Lachnospiraceae bacterium]
MKQIMELLNIDIMQIVIYLIMGICIWLLIRDIRCWYFKINEIVDEQKKQTEILNNILDKINPNTLEKNKGDGK